MPENMQSWILWIRKTQNQITLNSPSALQASWPNPFPPHFRVSSVTPVWFCYQWRRSLFGWDCLLIGTETYFWATWCSSSGSTPAVFPSTFSPSSSAVWRDPCPVPRSSDDIGFAALERKPGYLPRCSRIPARKDDLK